MACGAENRMSLPDKGQTNGSRVLASLVENIDSVCGYANHIAAGIMDEIPVHHVESSMSADPAQFVHLRVHSEFSLIDSLVRIKPLIKTVADMGMPAIAVTDQANMCSLVRFYQGMQGAGLKPICGCDIWVENIIPEEPPTQLVLLCMNTKGYKNLLELVSAGFQKNQHQGRAIIKRDWIFERNEGLIALSGGRRGEIGQSLLGSHPQQSNDLMEDWLRFFW